LFLQIIYFLGQRLSFLLIFPLSSPVDLATEIADLAIGLGLSFIAADDTDNRLCIHLQLGGIWLLTLRIQWYGAD